MDVSRRRLRAGTGSLRKWIQEALRSSEERLTLIVEAATNGLLGCNMQTSEVYISTEERAPRWLRKERHDEI